jgi:hypothetical protein
VELANSVGSNHGSITIPSSMEEIVLFILFDRIMAFSVQEMLAPEISLTL